MLGFSDFAIIHKILQFTNAFKCWNTFNLKTFLPKVVFHFFPSIFACMSFQICYQKLVSPSGKGSLLVPQCTTWISHMFWNIMKLLFVCRFRGEHQNMPMLLDDWEKMVEQHQKVYWQVHALVNTHTKIHCLHRTCQWFQIFLSSIFLLTSLWSWFCMYIIGLFFILSVWAWNTLKCSAILVFIWWFL